MESVKVENLNGLEMYSSNGLGFWGGLGVRGGVEEGFWGRFGGSKGVFWGGGNANNMAAHVLGGLRVEGL